MLDSQRPCKQSISCSIWLLTIHASSYIVSDTGYLSYRAVLSFGTCDCMVSRHVWPIQVSEHKLKSRSVV